MELDQHTHIIFSLHCRIVIDLLIAVGHIVSGTADLTEVTGEHSHCGCKALGLFNEFALTASNLWYLILAVDLLKALRNPFRFE